MEPTPLLSSKTMAITGGVTGIGRAIVLGYLSHGARVAVNHLGDATSASQYQSLVDEAAALFGDDRKKAQDSLAEVPGDVGDPETGKRIVDEVVKRWGRLDVFVSNAGVCEFREFLEYVYVLSFFTTVFRNLEKGVVCLVTLSRPVYSNTHSQSRCEIPSLTKFPIAESPQTSGPRRSTRTSQAPSTRSKPPPPTSPSNRRRGAPSSGYRASARWSAARSRRTTRRRKRASCR